MKKNKTFTAAEIAEHIFSQGVSLNLAIQKARDILKARLRDDAPSIFKIQDELETRAGLGLVHPRMVWALKRGY